MDVQLTNKYSNWLFFFVLSALLAILVTFSTITPEILVENSFELLSKTETWNVQVKDLTPYNQVFFFELQLCSESKSWYKVLVQGTDQPSGLIGDVVIDSEKTGKFSCDKTRIFQLRTHYSKYLIEFNVLSSDKAKVTIGFYNPEYVNFNIIIKGVIFSICLISTYLYLKLSPIRSDKKGLCVAILSAAGLFYIFPFKMFSAQWNYEFWVYFEAFFRFVFIQSFFWFSKSKGEFKTSENFIIFGVSGVFTLINLLSDTWFYFSLCLFALLCWFFVKIYVNKVAGITALKLYEKFDLIFEVFVVVFILMGVQCGIFSVVPLYAQLETLYFMVISVFLVYTHWGLRFIRSTALKDMSKNIYVPESEMIDIPFSNTIHGYK